MDDLDGYFKAGNNFSKIFSLDGLALLLDVIWERTAIFWIGLVITVIWI